MTANLSLGQTQRILPVCVAAGLTAPQTAYVLATAYWETAGTMEPVREAYFLGSAAESYRAKLGYSPWYGRGFVQLTWQANYERAGRELGIELLSNPDLALDPDVAAQVLVAGMVEGWFTRRKLGDYITGTRCDYVGARRIINGTDRADRVAEIAGEYEDALTPAPDYPYLRRGSRGTAVAQLQARLAILGAGIEVDGVFGNETHRALIAFQKVHDLTPDGIAGPRTWAAIIGETEE